MFDREVVRMRFKIFHGESNVAVEKLVNDWADKEGRGATIIRSDSSIGQVKVPVKAANGKASTRTVPYTTVTVWYEPKN